MFISLSFCKQLLFVYRARTYSLRVPFDKTSVDASPCLEGVCSGAVLFEDVPPACPLSRVLNEEDESCERALTKQWTMEVAAPAYKEY